MVRYLKIIEGCFLEDLYCIAADIAQPESVEAADRISGGNEGVVVQQVVEGSNHTEDQQEADDVGFFEEEVGNKKVDPGKK